MKLHLMKGEKFQKYNNIVCGGCGLKLTSKTIHDVNACVKKMDRV